MIRGVAESPFAVIGNRQPVVADDHQHRVGLLKLALERDREVLAGRDVAHIHEHALVAELRGEPVVDPSDVAGRVAAAVGEEDAAHW